ncbi:MAG TPA: c-type cytochrome domain-containing protein, partial [Bryobacteraceae bacterium]|nr:c-type cytochrome domain-containing protein [Bryobacteraceae bacterium]
MIRPVALAISLSALLCAQQPENRARAILAANCGGCHGSAKMSDLNIETREALLAGGKRGPAIVPGKASESLLYKAAAHDGDLKMPPGNKA